MAGNLVDRLIAAVGEDRREAGLVMSAVYQPVGGQGGLVMPPTFPGGEPSRPYLIGPRLVDGEVVDAVVMDQVPSQTNRVEESLARAQASGRVSLPLFVQTTPTPAGGVRLTSLDFPHRYADAYLRDSQIDGVRFDATAYGKALRSASVDDVRPLFEREPYTLLFGAWDSHRKGRQAKFARLYSSEMFGTRPEVWIRRAGRVDPVNLTGAVDDTSKVSEGWQFVIPGEKGRKEKGQKLSEIGLGHIAPNPAHGGVTVDEVRRRGWVSFAGLERLRFGDADADAAVLARATLAALALVGDRLTFGGASLMLRSGCDLTRKTETLGFEVAGGEVEPFEVSAAEAIDVFTQLRERAAKAGIAMATDVVVVEPTPALASAIAYAVTRAAADAEE